MGTRLGEVLLHSFILLLFLKSNFIYLLGFENTVSYHKYLGYFPEFAHICIAFITFSHSYRPFSRSLHIAEHLFQRKKSCKKWLTRLSDKTELCEALIGALITANATALIPLCSAGWLSSNSALRVHTFHSLYSQVISSLQKLKFPVAFPCNQLGEWLALAPKVIPAAATFKKELDGLRVA